jgi:hypothetical protein
MRSVVRTSACRICCWRTGRGTAASASSVARPCRKACSPTSWVGRPSFFSTGLRPGHRERAARCVWRPCASRLSPCLRAYRRHCQSPRRISRFLHAMERRRFRNSGPETSESRVRETTVILVLSYRSNAHLLLSHVTSRLAIDAFQIRPVIMGNPKVIDSSVD